MIAHGIGSAEEDEEFRMKERVVFYMPSKWTAKVRNSSWLNPSVRTKYPLDAKSWESSLFYNAK